MIRELIRQLLTEAIEEGQKHGKLPFFGCEKIEITVPPKGVGADYSTNIALVAGKKVKQNPMDIAETIEEYLRNRGVGQPGECAQDIKIEKPGFINFYVPDSAKLEEVFLMLKEKEDYGNLKIGQKKKVQVEFISANPTGPLTLGNGRGGFYGDVLANVLQKANFKVTREYFINDAGHQVRVLGHSVLGDEQAQYKGQYIDDLRKRLKDSLNEEPKKIGEKAAKIILEEMIKPTVTERMKIKFDEWVSEHELHESGTPEKVLKALKKNDLIYEADGATWFKSTLFGDDKDRVLITSDKTAKNGEATYFLADIAYHYNKFKKEKFEEVIDIWGADHYGYINRLQAAMKALELPGELNIVIMQLVRLFEGGKEVKMSKRLSTYVTLDELLEEIPLDVARFFFLMRSPDTHMDFDLDLAKEQSEKNPVYYVQYAHARVCSIIKKAKDLGLESDRKAIPRLKPEKAERELIGQLVKFPEIVEDIARDYQVHRLPQYALELVRAFHKFYEECRVIDPENKELTAMRLALVDAVKIILENTLGLMGISAPEKM